MTQATDLGNIANQLAAAYRSRVNANIQAVVTQHYGATEPSPLYPNMIWFSSGDGYIKLRNPTNTAWQTVGTIGPPMKWTNVDIPSTAWKTGDIKPSFAGGEAGWVVLDDGTIGDPVLRRHHPRQPGLRGAVQPASGRPAGCTCSSPAPGRRSAVAPAPPPTSTRTGICSCRRCSAARWRRGPGRRAWTNRRAGGAAWDGDESVSSPKRIMPGHYHTFGVPDHGHPTASISPRRTAATRSGAGGFPTGGNRTSTGA